MSRIVLRYFGLDTDVGFLRIKQQYIANRVWLIAFYIHSFSAIITLFAGFTQFSNDLRRKHVELHKNIGKLYVYVVLLLASPTGLILGIYANGHVPSKIGFSLLSILWFWFTLRAVQHIKNDRVNKHQSFMIRSYALALSAITLRIWKYGLANTIAPDPLVLYQIVTWLGFILNLLIAEWIIIKLQKPE